MRRLKSVGKSKITLKKGKKKGKLMNVTKFAVFNNKPEDIERILRLVGLNVNQENNLVYNGKIVLCEGCNTVIEKVHLGSVMAQSEHFFCDNPLCFVSFVRRYKL